MQRFLNSSRPPAWIAAAVLAAGCGKPPAGTQGPPQGDFPVNAVVAPAEERVIENRVVLVASLEAKERVTLVSELDARVREILVREGQAVREKEVLFKLDDVQATARRDEATAAFQLAETTFKRTRDLLANQTVPQQEFDRARSEYQSAQAALARAEDELAKTVIRAPFDGVIGERSVSTGQYAPPGTALAELVQMHPLDVVFDAPERYLGRLETGRTAQFTPDAFPDQSFPGTVTYVAPSVTEASRTVRVKAEIANPRQRLKAGMYGQAALVLGDEQSGLVIPESAVQFDGDTTRVMTVDAEGRSGIRPITLGKRFSGSVQVVDGLSVGELVVVEGFQKMGPGMRVVAAPESERYGITPGPLGPSPAETNAAPAEVRGEADAS